jgi:hypothetical protein
MAEHKRQHFVPRSYLQAWCDVNVPEGHTPYVWVFSRDGSNPRRRAPGNLFHETDLYTIELPGGGRNLILEHGLSQLENEFVSIRDRTLQAQQPLAPGSREHAYLCGFVAATHARTPAQRDHQQEEWGKVLDMANEMLEWAKTATPEQKQAAADLSCLNRGPYMGYEDVKLLAEKPLQAAMAVTIDVATPLLMSLDLAILTYSEGASGFITSDNPCVWIDPEGCKRPPFYQSPGIIYESIEITLAVSPRQLILLNRRGFDGYLSVPEKVVDEFNRRTRFGCVDYFVNNTNEARPIWFDPGVEPPDSWRKTYPKSSDSKITKKTEPDPQELE